MVPLWVFKAITQSSKKKKYGLESWIWLLVLLSLNFGWRFQHHAFSWLPCPEKDLYNCNIYIIKMTESY